MKDRKIEDRIRLLVNGKVNVNERGANLSIKGAMRLLI